jgi:hypothetical protein
MRKQFLSFMLFPPGVIDSRALRWIGGHFMEIDGNMHHFSEEISDE